ETVGQFDISIDSDDFHYGKGKNAKVPAYEERIEFLADKVMAAHLVKDRMEEALAKDEMYDLWMDLEIPLTKILAEMEIRGITVKPESLKEMETEIQDRIDEMESRIHELAGESFNINSPK